MIFRSHFIAIVLSALVAVAVAKDTCLFNSTHCACSLKPAEKSGVCLHHVGEAEGKCKVDLCKSDNFICNCDGKDLCEYKKCGAWKMADTAADIPPVGTDGLECKYIETNKCLNKVVEIPPEYKIVQIGEKKTAASMFNMTFEVDKGDAMTSSFRDGNGDGLHGLWPDVNSLKSRQLNFRLYQGDSDPKSKFVCMVINSWAFTTDKAPNYKVITEISAENGDTLKWMQCDDNQHFNQNLQATHHECLPPYEGSTLHAKHAGMGIYSDGWCAGPLLENGNAVSIKLSGIQNLAGMNFLGSDGELSEYLFADKTAMAALTGSSGEIGEVPVIKINLAGISMEETKSTTARTEVADVSTGPSLVRFALSN